MEFTQLQADSSIHRHSSFGIYSNTCTLDKRNNMNIKLGGFSCLPHPRDVPVLINITVSSQATASTTSSNSTSATSTLSSNATSLYLSVYTTSSANVTLAGVVLPTVDTTGRTPTLNLVAMVTNPANRSEKVPLGTVVLPEDVREGLPPVAGASAMEITVEIAGVASAAILESNGVLIYPMIHAKWLDM
jgi:hypothetical protein